ncbi:MAG: hypothetical protein PVI79_01410 [Gammaproteobacteria bacterium]|jgi:hypothetical protein
MSHANIESDEIDLESLDEDLTDFTDGENIPVDHVNFEIEQYNKMQGSFRKVTVFNDSQCYQTIKNKHRKKYKYRIDIAYLDPRPFRSRVMPWRWLYAGLALLGIDAVLLLGGFVDASSVNLLGLSIALLVVGIISLLAFFYYSRDRVFFRTQYGKIRLIELINKNPDNKTFRSFINSFVMQINQAKTARGLSQAKFLARELKELRRLKDDSVIPGNSYEKAKRLIFKHEAFTSAE